MWRLAALLLSCRDQSACLIRKHIVSHCISPAHVSVISQGITFKRTNSGRNSSETSRYEFNGSFSIPSTEEEILGSKATAPRFSRLQDRVPQVQPPGRALSKASLLKQDTFDQDNNGKGFHIFSFLFILSIGIQGHSQLR